MTPWMLGRFYFPKIFYEMRETTPLEGRIALITVFSFFIPLMLTGFVAFGFMRWVYYKTGLDNAEAHGQEF